MKTVAIIQARMGSTRLPGKVLAEVAGKPLLVHMLERLERCELLDEIGVAIASGVENRPIAEAVSDLMLERDYNECRLGWSWGDEDDVLSRVLHAAHLTQADLIVELTADCPLIDPKIVDLAIKRYRMISRTSGLDFLSTSRDSFPHPENAYPRGMDVRVFPVGVLEEVDRLTKDPVDREHVSLYIWEHPQHYRIWNLAAPDKLRDDVRLTVDTPDDLELVRAIFEHFAPSNDFHLPDIIRYLDENPELRELNRSVQQKKVR